MKNFTNMAEEDLWIYYKENKDTQVRDILVQRYTPLVKYVAGKVAVGMPNTVEFDDLVGYGVFGLFDAIEKYDPHKYVKFKTYAVTRIRGSIFDELRSLDWVPRSVRQKMREVEDTIRRIESNKGGTAEDIEIADAMGISLKEYEKTIKKISSTSIVSLGESLYIGNDNNKVTISDNIESPVKMNPDSIIEDKETIRVLYSYVEELPEKERHVIVLYYLEDLTLKEIGKILKVTESRVSQLHTKAITHLKAKLTNIRKGII